MKWAIRIVGAVMVFFIGYLVYLGGFRKIIIDEKDMGPYTMVYKEYIGDYNQTGERIGIFVDQLHACDLKFESPFTIFLDAPGHVPASHQRSQVGVLLQDPDTAILASLDPSFQIKYFPKQECAVGTFPFRHSYSPWIGIAKVYPAMNEFFKDGELDLKKAYSLEIYGSDQITYIIPKQQ